ncbi:MAG: cysteine hydrolase [Planctomycetota bacterium]|jgi:nicotinamidase-related amidase|nr:cysteine hydrolase [Planctomycetota bacterium]MDP7248819.1 cysteine hydrolase [Planctomycetota bacterium]
MLTISGRKVCESVSEVVSPERAVLAVIDIEDSEMWSKGADAIILQKVKELIESARNINLPVFYFFNQRGPSLNNISPAYIRVLMNLGWDIERIRTEWPEGEAVGALHPDFNPRPIESVLPKGRGAAFEGTDFELLLKSMQRESVILVGCSTDWCLEATAWYATNKDYYTVVVEDCVRGPRPDGHAAALKQFRAIGLDVLDSSELSKIWGTMLPAATD